MQYRNHILFALVLFFLGVQQCLLAQTGFNLDIEKPKPYENRELKAEKTGEKKLKLYKRILQNTTTHYNYFFNANNIINEVIEKAKAAHKDDFSSLLSFYNYNLDATAQDKTQLDSVIYKAQTGIVMHDLRNDWVDDLYLLWGAAYFLQKEYDSAYQMFQFINYAFAEKEKDGYYKYIGSRMDGNTALSIASKEDMKFGEGLISDPPSRNNAFIWQIRTLTNAKRITEAGSLIETLKNDPNFPERLQTDLEEVQAYWFYQQEMWDSTAAHLKLALENAKTQQEKARWEYLIAQLLERSNKNDEAAIYYTKAISHTTDPVMEVYGRLNLIRVNKTGTGDSYIDENIAALLSMAKKDKYEDYRDVIYYMAAQMEMARNNPLAAQEYILKGSKYNNNNLLSRNQTFLQVADLLFIQKKYKPASGFYDSVQIANLKPADADRVTTRKNVLLFLVNNLNTIERQDSLQKIAAMPEEERTAYIKKLSRQLRLKQGLKDEDVAATGITAAYDPFRENVKGEWYFYNTNLKARGIATFKQAWGNRPNVDNWRRFTNVTAMLRSNNPNATRNVVNVVIDPVAPPTENNLLANVPLSAAAMQQSNDSIQNALYTAANLYSNELNDYQSAIAALEEIRRRFPQFPNMSDVLFQQYYSYTKTGNKAMAEAAKKELLQNYPTSRYASILEKGVDPLSNAPTNAVTQAYEHVYDLFIEGSFEEAEAAKQKADSTYHTNYWSPQLLYIEAVYHIRQRADSTAFKILNTLVRQNQNTPIAAKATTLMDVLSRRQQIENELNNLQITRPQEDSVVTRPVVAKVQTVEEETPVSLRRGQADIVKKEALNTTKPTATLPGTKPQINNVQVSAIKAPPVAVATPEAEVVKKDSVITKPQDIALNKPVIKPIIDSGVSKVDTAVKANNVVITKPVEKPVITDTIAKATTQIAKPVVKDTVAAKPVVKPAAPSRPASIFSYETETPYYASVILNKVDIVFGNEAKNAFNRYNREKYYNQQQLDIKIVNIDADNKLLLIGNFANAKAAVDYVSTVKEVAAKEVIPWLKPEKYSFTVISETNVEVLKANPDINTYKKFVDQNLQLKF